jgi:hypothetical protein
MSATIKLSSKLPGDAEINGLDGLHDRLCIDATPILCLAWIVPTTKTADIETGEEVPRVEVRRIEPIGPVTTVPTQITTLAAELYERRTGRAALPITSLLAPTGDVEEIDDERMVKADVAAAEMLMSMSPEERDVAMSDGDDEARQHLALVPDDGADVYVFDGQDYDDE